MSETNRFDLKERTYQFAKGVALFCKDLPRTLSNREYITQAIRASGSIGANYIEANEALSKRDFILRIKISRKEAKEAVYWLQLIIETNPENFNSRGVSLREEAVELKKIFSAIVEKSQ